MMDNGLRSAARRLMILMAASSVPALLVLALSDWQSVRFLGDTHWLVSGDADHVQALISAYLGPAWFDVLLAAVVLALTIGIFRRGGRAAFLAVAFLSLLLLGMGCYRLALGIPAEAMSNSIWLAVVALLVGGFCGLGAAIAGFLGAPAIEPPKPLIPPVPPSHQAG